MGKAFFLSLSSIRYLSISLKRLIPLMGKLTTETWEVGSISQFHSQVVHLAVTVDAIALVGKWITSRDVFVGKAAVRLIFSLSFRSLGMLLFTTKRSLGINCPGK